MKVLLLGSTGFIGRNLKEQLPYQLLTPSRKELDLLNDEMVMNFFYTTSIDVVINCVNCKDNYKAFRNLEYYFKGKIIQLGSGAEYRKQNDIENVDEEEFNYLICKPADWYGREKYAISEWLEDKLKKNIIVLRPFGVFGKYEDVNRRFISKAILDNLMGDDITIYQDVKFSYVWVNDLVQIIDYFINNDPKYQFYNVGGHQMTLVEIAKKIGKYKVLEKGMDNEYTCDDSRVRNETRLKYIPFDNCLMEVKRYYEEIYV